MVADGRTRKEIAGSLDVSLSTVRRDIEALVFLTSAGSSQRLPMVLQTSYADKLNVPLVHDDRSIVRETVRKSRQNIVFATVIFALVVTGYGMHLLITAIEVWGLEGVSASLIYSLHLTTIVLLGVALALFGGAPERECAAVWIGYFLLDNLVLDKYFGHLPGSQLEAWSTIYFEWFLGNLFFLIGFSIIYLRHRLYYVGLLITAQIFSISVHAVQGALKPFQPFAYAAVIVIAYYFLWVILSVGLCIAFNREPTKAPFKWL